MTSLVILTSVLIILAAGLIIATVVVYRARQGDIEFSGTFVRQNENNLYIAAPIKPFRDLVPQSPFLRG